MEYRTTEYGKKTVEIQFPERLQRSDKTKNAPGGIRLTGSVVWRCFIAALLGVCIYFNYLKPVSPVPAPAVPPPAPEEPAAAPQQDWKVSSVSVPMLGAPVASIEVDSPRAMITQLENLGLWELEEEGAFEVPPVVFTNFPNRLSELEVGAKKRIFFRTLLPVALVAMAEVEQERTELKRILAKLGNDNSIVFSEKKPDWKLGLTGKEIAFIVNLTEKYRSHRASDLLYRVDVLPVSLVLAQGAFESFWGTSRFAREGNNLFGMWTWGEEGIIPARRDPGKTHKLAVYDSILDAVRNFVLTINRLPAYKKLRKIRRKTRNAMAIADGLYYYSERGNAYIVDVKTIIRVNDLMRYDNFVLGDPAEPLPTRTRLASL